MSATAVKHHHLFCIQVNGIENHPFKLICVISLFAAYTYGYKKKKKLPVGRPPGGQSNLEHGPKVPGKRGRKKKRFHLIHKKTHSASAQKPEEENGKEQEEGSTNGDTKDEGFIDDDRSGDENGDNVEENSK